MTRWPILPYDQLSVSLELGQSITNPLLTHREALSVTGQALTTFGIDPVEAVPQWPELEVRFGEDTRPNAPLDEFFLATVRAATTGILKRTPEPQEVEVEVGTAANLNCMLEGALANGVPEDRTRRVIRQTLSGEMRSLEGRGSYTAVSDMRYLQGVMDHGGFSSVGTEIRWLVRTVRAIRTYGVDIYGPENPRL